MPNRWNPRSRKWEEVNIYKNYQKGDHLMIKCILTTPDKREIPVYFRQRQYKKLEAKIDRMSFREKIGWLFRK